MTEAIPPVAADCLNGRFAAHEISEALTVAFWLHGHADTLCQDRLATAHRHFADLAEALGYRIERVNPEAAQ